VVFKVASTCSSIRASFEYMVTTFALDRIMLSLQVFPEDVTSPVPGYQGETYFKRVMLLNPGPAHTR